MKLTPGWNCWDWERQEIGNNKEKKEEFQAMDNAYIQAVMNVSVI